jgi:hypothetical protein
MDLPPELAEPLPCQDWVMTTDWVVGGGTLVLAGVTASLEAGITVP